VKRGLGFGLAALLAVGVGIAIFASVAGGKGNGNGNGGPSTPGDSPSALTVVRGVIGSEKKPFFQDLRVQAVFRAHGLDVQVDTAGSRQIATSVDLSQYGFAFPAGVPAAAKIIADKHVNGSFTAFYTPMAIASWKEIANLLVAAGVAHDQGGYYTFDVAKYLELVKKNTRWTDLPNNASYPASKSILITSTDVRTSNSAAMYLSIASYVANGNNVVQNNAQGDTVLPVVTPLFLRQGFVETSSEEPFDDYLTIGIGKDPMVMIYESQFLSHAFAKDGELKPDMVLMYPSPDVLSKHTFIPLNAGGARVGQLIQTDPTLLRLAVQYGFRTGNSTYFDAQVAQSGLTIPENLVNVIEPPTYDALEHMISGIEAAYNANNSNQEGGSSP
jgi:hypothetical protein